MSDNGSNDATSKPLLLTVEEAAKALRISRASFYVLLKAGEIEVVHIGKRTLVPPDALDTYLERLRTTTAT